MCLYLSAALLLLLLQECSDVAEPAPEVLLPLLPFQKQFLAWGLKQVRCCCCCCCCCTALVGKIVFTCVQVLIECNLVVGGVRGSW
jgi:hypothetical protein